MQGQFISNSLAQSKVVYNISSPNVFDSVTLLDISEIPSETSIDFYMSPDDGLNWEQVVSGLKHNFSFQGESLKWKAEFHTDSIIDTPELFSLSLVVEYLDPTTPTIPPPENGSKLIKILVPIAVATVVIAATVTFVITRRRKRRRMD